MAIFIPPIHRRQPRFYDPFEEEFCHHRYYYPLHPMATTAGIMSPWNQFATPMLAQVPALIPSTLSPTLPTIMSIPDSIKNENGKFEIKCSIPDGFSPEELKLDLDGNKLILAGEKKNSKSFQRIERIFCVPDGVEKATIKCEFDPSTNQLCIEAASSAKALETNQGEQATVEKKKKESAAPESTEAMNVSKNPELSEFVETSIPEGSKSPENLSIKGKDYIERETDEGIEIDTTVSAA